MLHAGPPPVGVPSVQDLARQILPAATVEEKASRAARDGTEKIMFENNRLVLLGIG